MLAAKPVTMVVTGQLTKRRVSKIAYPENISPPGELMNTMIGASGSSCSSRRICPRTFCVSSELTC